MPQNQLVYSCLAASFYILVHKVRLILRAMLSADCRESEETMGQGIPSFLGFGTKTSAKSLFLPVEI